MAPVMKLLSVNVALPREHTVKGKTVRTSIVKEPVPRRVQVKTLDIEGNGQADLIGHGGEMRAVLVYSHENSAHWETELGRTDFRFGQFGENFTVEGMLDDEIHVGDRFRIGTAVFEVTQPRVPCYKLGIKMQTDGFYSRLLQSGRAGFYKSFESLLELAEANGLSPDYSCRSGVCQTCASPLEEGDGEYVLEPLEPPDPGSVLICCSTPTTDRVVLGL